jgi:DeoR/GlpR family transcriptional regulator of sugar metabolism
MLYERTIGITRRHERLLRLIRSGEFSTPALAKELGVSDQTIYRDILHLKRSGYTIRPRRRAGGWFYVLGSEPETSHPEEGRFPS